MNWCANPPADTFVGPLQNQWSDVEVCRCIKEPERPKHMMAVFYANIVMLWRLFAGHSPVRQVLL
jgi:hypothetical protein